MHYAMCDIHGRYDKFLRMLELIKFSDKDTLYVIGDAIDRGPDGGKVLLDILTMKNAVMMMGNHEYMMLNAFYDESARPVWIRNGADSTINDILDIGVPPEEFVSAIKELPVAIQLEIEDKKYYLVHACPIKIGTASVVRMADLSSEKIDAAVWDRGTADDELENRYLEKIFEEYPDTTFLVGHTPVYMCSYGTENLGVPQISTGFEGRVINLDCGCSSNKALGCLCLETQEKYYT